MRVTLKLEFCGIKMFEQKWSQCIINCLKHLNETTSNDLITNKRKSLMLLRLRRVANMNISILYNTLRLE